MRRHVFVTMLTILGAAGCAGRTADVAQTSVAAQGEELLVEAFTDAADPAFWAIEIRPRGAEHLAIVLSSEDAPIDGETAEGLAAVRETFGDELAASGTWFGCAVAECASPSISACIDDIRRHGCR